jgi:hypothetical protein
MAVSRNDDEERAARIDMILEEFRLNSEDLQELARRAIDHARRMREDNRVVRESLASQSRTSAGAKKGVAARPRALRRRRHREG